jgi:hypothetical protein
MGLLPAVPQCELLYSLMYHTVLVVATNGRIQDTRTLSLVVASREIYRAADLPIAVRFSLVSI